MMTNEQRRTNKKDCSDRLFWCVKMKMVLSEDNLLLLETVHNVLKFTGGFARRLRLSLVMTDIFLEIKNSDGLILAAEDVPSSVVEEVQNSKKPHLDFSASKDEETYIDFYSNKF